MNKGGEREGRKNVSDQLREKSKEGGKNEMTD